MLRRNAWITLSGTDAKDFLHRLTTVNLKTLAPGRGVPGCFLTPQGKIRAFFNLWCLAPEEYAFDLEIGETGRWKDALLATIDQFTFAEKISLKEHPELECRSIAHGHPPLESGQTLLDSGIRFCRVGEITHAWGSREVLTPLREIPSEELERLRIEAMIPRADHEIVDDANPLEIGLRSAIAENKGCYPGQEVIEKIISLGSPAKRLALIQGAGTAPARGEKILADGSEIGAVTSSIATPQGFSALALIRKTQAKEGLNTGSGRIVRIAPYA